MILGGLAECPFLRQEAGHVVALEAQKQAPSTFAP